MAQLTTVMLLFGGESSEHTVSISSARNVYAALDETKFEVVLGFIDKTGRWWLLDSLEGVGDISSALQLIPVMGTKSFITLPSGEYVKPDVILPILHGENGEDGTVQGLARLMHVPIVGCSVAASAVCIDKVLTKELLEYNGIKTTPYAVHIAGDPTPSYKKLSEELSPTLFIKPAGCGSSVGVGKAKNEAELKTALVEAHKYDPKVLIEKAITARELEVAMLGAGSHAKASGVGEIIPDSEFYDFESKYSATSQSKVIIPANLPEKTSEEIRDIAIRAYRALGCEGLSRVDFFLSDDGVVYLNEVNTLPGFTNISMYPKLWRKQGMSYSELIETLISLAIKPTK
jgi:D-alanine-D-alanine ligase